MTEKITVIDSIMGSGKTTWAINYMKKNRHKKFLYITPFKREDDRIKSELPQFYVPKDEDNRPKLPRVKQQLRRKRSIASTHSLFQYFDEECIKLVRDGGYTLILDEVLEVINLLKMKKSDIKLVTNSGAAITDPDTYKMTWTDKYVNLSKDIGYGWLEGLIKLDKVINVDDDCLMWEFPPDIFRSFKDIFVLTYMFDSNILSNYFDVNNLSYKKCSVENGELCDFKIPDLSKIRNLINIYEGPLNTNIYQTKYSFSSTWFTKEENEEYIGKLGNNIYNWFYNIKKVPYKERMWTCFKENFNTLKGKGYTKGFVTSSCRATNDYREKSCLAYCINKFHNPMIKKYFAYQNSILNEDQYALSELLQWIWRSRIRDGKQIDIYIPSQRMRTLLTNWLYY